jgi:hypothetical protein
MLCKPQPSQEMKLRISQLFPSDYCAYPKMSLTAVYSTPVTSTALTADGVSSRRPVLAIGSLVTAEDGKYQSLIQSLEKNMQVERQMLDRLMDGGGFYPSVCFRR